MACLGTKSFDTMNGWWEGVPSMLKQPLRPLRHIWANGLRNRFGFSPKSVRKMPFKAHNL
jgi:hypothetical protein